MHAAAAFEPLQPYGGKARAKRLVGVLPVLPPEMATLGPLWFGAALPEGAETRMGPCRLRQGSVHSVASGDHLCAQGKVGKAAFTVSLPEQALPDFLTQAGIAHDDRKIDPFLQALLLEHLFGPMIAAFEASTGQEVALDRVVRRAGADVAGLPVQLGFAEGEEVTAFFDIAPIDLQRLLPGSCRHDLAGLLGHVPVPVILCAGAMWITAAQLAEWKPRDLIVFAAGKAPRDPLLCFAGGAVAQVRPDGDAFVLLTHFQRPMSPQHERMSSMSQEDLAQSPDAALQPIGLRALDEVALMVSFDLGQRSMTLAELGQMTVGTVFEIGNLSDDQARIRVNGTVVGSARLVQIGDRLGVQITAMRQIDA